MSRKQKTLESPTDRILPAVAAMKFWSRFQNPPPMLAFTFAEPPGNVAESFDELSRLPQLPTDDSLVYSLRISLNGSKPSVWRRILVKAINLETLHHVVQFTMGWNDSHLHEFEIRKVRVPLVEDGASIDERSVSIAQLHAARIKKFRYTYDFGDDWRHTISIEKAFTASPECDYPLCITGKGTCPLEDVGGMWRWTKLLEAVRSPETRRDDEIKLLFERLGTDFVPVHFDRETINERLRLAFNKNVRRKGGA